MTLSSLEMTGNPASSGAPELPALPPWTLSEALRFFLLAYLAAPLTAEAVLALAWPASPPWVGFFAQHATPALVWLLCFAYLARREGRQALIRQLGLRDGSLTRGSLLRFTALAAGGVLAIVAAINGLSFWASGESLANPYEDFSRPAVEATILAGLLLAPLLEELTFRGFLQPAIARHASTGAAITLSAVVFALSHTLYADAPFAWMSALALGLWFGWLRARTGSIWPGVAGHLLNNALAAASLLGV
ncbi:MAG: CPBP family intramembrane metalloprotease [Vampirovibrionales bacterium]|nr:CPBP family intramembrane metalloprotease [Vampirovibrionales bacterium]